MGMEIEFMTFSTLIFAILMVVCFRPLRGSYVAKEVIQHQITEQQRYKDNQAFSKELEDVHSNFERKFADALRGQLKKQIS